MMDGWRWLFMNMGVGGIGSMHVNDVVDIVI